MATSIESTVVPHFWSPVHRTPPHVPPVHRQESPPFQRRKGKEPAEEPPTRHRPSGPDPPAHHAPQFAPSAPGPSSRGDTSRERAEAAPSAGSPPIDAPSAVGPIGQGTSGVRPPAMSPSATDDGDRENAVGNQPASDGDAARVHSPSALDILATSSEAAAVPSQAAHVEDVQPHSGQSPTQSMATEILHSDDDDGGSTEEMSGAEDTEEEEEEIVGAPAAALSEQVIPLLRYLDRKVDKYADPLQPGSYIELVRRRTRTKVHTSKLLARVDQELRDLKEKHECLWGQYKLNQKFYKHSEKMKDEKLDELTKEQVKVKEALISEQAQNRILSEELVRQTRLLEQCQLARQADEELIRRLQSECGELRAQRAEAELQLVVVEDDRRREEDWQGRELVRGSRPRRRRSTGSAECSVAWFRAGV
ncbi:hypothetical protein AXG93_2202s1020 [Marchantia polymorpha subsp. ruderalis]|uniref:Uncharacterized protein n=1 Tax=Marchantia polymorpha subsp. ruderalis TaxID=1480154 RepID=A0A176W6M6_MARPO|nr:hypothetical protein AXG93_2202s1020 [Marchantia polymorpha subsp. ruderalis]